MLPELFQQLSKTLDYYTGQYECRVMRGADIKKCFDIRRLVFGQELKREGGGPADIDPYDRKSVHIGCRYRKTGEWIGCIRMTPSLDLKGSAKHEKEYHLNKFPENLLKYLCAVSRLAVLPAYRKSPAGLLLALKCYEVAMRDLGYRISVINCEPGLYPFYCRLGYRPLGRVFVSPFGGYRIPLFGIIHDYSYLRHVRSPFLKVAQKLKFPEKKEGLEWQAQYHATTGLIDVGINLITSDHSEEYHARLAEGMSAAGRKELCGHASHIQCEAGDIVLAKGEGSRFLGFVHKGLLEVRRKPGQTLALLGEGDIFGELAFILGVPRTADVVASAPGTEIVLLSLSAIDRIKSAEDRICAWKNLARIAATRYLRSQP